MFHVLDHACVVYTGELSQSTQYIIDRYGKNLDDAIRSGIRILDTDSLRVFKEGRKTIRGNSSAD